jgi:hypothetical protein
MRALRISLRMLVFAASFLWLTHASQLVPSVTQSCVSYQMGQGNCPSGCTSTSYNTAYATGQGMYNLVAVSAPCGSNKPGQQCVQPQNVNMAELDPSCCVQAGSYCGQSGM